mgnify:CR=1 FL=1
MRDFQINFANDSGFSGLGFFAICSLDFLPWGESIFRFVGGFGCGKIYIQFIYLQYLQGVFILTFEVVFIK